MNKMLISSLKVVVIFAAAGLLSYMVLKAQMTKARTNSVTETTEKTVSKTDDPASEEIDDTSRPELTFVGSTKVETIDSSEILKTVKIEGFHSSKSLVLAPDEEVVSFPSSKSAPIDFEISNSKGKKSSGKKKYVELEPDPFVEKEKKEFFHSSKAPLTTVIVENVEDNSKKEVSIEEEMEANKFKKDEFVKFLLKEHRSMKKLLKEKDAEIARLKKKLGE